MTKQFFTIPAREHPSAGKYLHIIQAMADGKSTKMIANELGLSPRTIEKHRDDARKHIGAESSFQMIAIAFRKGIIK